MVEGSSIINLGDLTKPATILIEKVSNAVGVLYEPRRIKNVAKAEVEVAKIKALANIELDEIQYRGIERFVHQEARKQQNIENITASAISQLPNNAKSEDLDEDWVTHFFDKCDKVSDVEMQTLWSSLLTGEASNPGTYSKRTVDFVASMDKKDAELFTKFGQFVWTIGGPTPLIFDADNEVYKEQGINFTTLKHLDAIGLISFETTSGYARRGLPKKEVLYYSSKPTLFEFKKDTNNEIKTGKVLLTNAGTELLGLCVTEINQKFYEYVIEELSKQGITVSNLSA
ncbi:DUF2806 domain-containing protein [Aliivibrio sp. S3MY1]|uniref:DUF2806 domain-containing protein n=1 Tax=unclassified Aliivibrio TaxID=2645654 RepID=UPI0023792E64|nr:MULTISPECIES: DUF2806 domain-containing protein [unclassified Aliivibrio]MDD9197563.1 DUF2806 domain-containing protein [Aliivibrio sp. S3MY1]MDD9200815.1 DUF2806 domain-containing protein [Aliivibrio sp. S2MY1]